MTHLPQVKSTRSDVIELGLLHRLNFDLQSTPHFIVPNFNRKNLFNRRVDYPAEKRSYRHGGKRIC